MDRVEQEKKVPAEENALVLRIVGWLLLIFDAIPVLFVWDGWRIGSNLWMWWVLAEAFLGLILIAAAQLLISKLVTSAVVGEDRHTAAIDTYREVA